VTAGGGRPVVPLETRIRRHGSQLTVTGMVGSLRLSEVAGDLFLAMDGERDVAEVARVVAEQYGVDPGMVAEDLRVLLADLIAADAVRLED
jgi:hypothetical protein